MATSEVFFSDLRTSAKESLPSKLVRLMDRAGLGEAVVPKGLIAVKLHFGEKGNSGFIRPLFIRRIVERVKELGAYPFLTDTNTLYSGTRGNSVDHLNTATENGFAYSVVNAPVIIADGMRGASYSMVKVNGRHIETAYLAKEIVESDALIGVAHFKGHELAGFGGTIKNLGMGCASRRGKLELHSDLSPKVKRKRCVGCGDCIQRCAQGAISLIEERAVIDPKKCVGCGECISICPKRAVHVQWSGDAAGFQKKMAEYALAVLRAKPGKVLFLNFLTHITPDCDCHGHSDAPIVQDIGITASKDPVAIDQASVDLVNRQVASVHSCLTTHAKAGEDKFRGVYPRIDWSVQLDYGEELGLGSRQYHLITI